MNIKSITTKSGQKINLNKISILVGANNVGKSQTLRDIQQRMERGLVSKPVLLDEIEFEKPSKFEDLLSGLVVTDSPNSLNTKVVHGIKNNLSQLDQFQYDENHFKNLFERNANLDFILGNISKFRVSHLDAASRLQLVKTTESFNPDSDNPKNILQNLFTQPDNEKLLKKAFQTAFSMDIILDYSGMKDFCLRVAKSFPKIPDNPREAYLITKNYNKIDDQGDGFRSFVGIILSILFSKERVILLDEPEAFLHPAQARFLGKWIADNSSLLQGQLLIATHNANFLSGILASDKEVDIFRLNRKDDHTSYNLIPPTATEKLAKSPMLSSQRVLESIFHRGVIVCEADADRTIYQTVSTLVHDNQEVLFIHSHNKQTLKDVASLLLDAKIPVATVADIDLLNDKNDFVKLIKLMSDSEKNEKILEQRDKVAEEINKTSDEEILKSVKNDIELFLAQLNNQEHTFDGAKGAVNRIRKKMSKWNSPKKNGIEGFPENVQKDVQEIILELQKMNIFIVPVGELEGWMDLGTSQKNKWIIQALEQIHKGNTSQELKRFTGDLIKSVTN